METSQQATILNLALSISSFTPNKQVVFWHTLNRLDSSDELFGHAIVAAAETYDIDILSDDILDAQIHNGVDIYNRMEGGIFVEVSLSIRSPTTFC